MKMCFSFCSGMNILLIFVLMMMIPSVSMSLRLSFDQSADRHQANNGGRKNEANKQTNEDGKEEIRGIKTAAGSRLPDCTHACGSCMPCRLVIVGSACAISLTEAESCPISYRCMCNNKTYPVP